MDPGEGIHPCVIPVQTIAGSYPEYPFAVGVQAIDGVVRNSFFIPAIITVGDHVPGIKSIKPVTGTKPHKAIGILNHGVHRALG
jgi:hypothetical protein